MKRFSFALAIGAFALLPLGLSQPASAHDYYDGYRGDSRLERDIDKDRANSITIMPSTAITASASSRPFATAII